MSNNKVKVGVSLTKEAHSVMLAHYATARTMGEFLSNLVMEYHATQTAMPPGMRRLEVMIDGLSARLERLEERLGEE